MGPKSEHSQTTDPAPSSGRVSPDDVQIRDKGAPGPGPHERKPWNHAVALRLNESDPSLCHRFGHPRSLPAPVLVPGGARSVHRCQPEPRSFRHAGGHELGLEPLIRAGHALSVRGLVLSDSGQAGAGVIEPGLAALGQGLAALPQGQGVLQRDGTRLEALHDGHQLLARPLITE